MTVMTIDKTSLDGREVEGIYSMDSIDSLDYAHSLKKLGFKMDCNSLGNSNDAMGVHSPLVAGIA